ncbi:MAG TPA: response regulator [Desulfuromonadaceae bacterium]
MTMADTGCAAGSDGELILIVEDSRTQAEQLRYILEKYLYRVALAGNGGEALAMVGTLKPDLVISDICMPEMDGYELSRRIKELDGPGAAPVILLTSLTDLGDVIRGLECGADNFITKPYDEAYLLSRVGHLLVNRRYPREPEAVQATKVTFEGQEYTISAGQRQILDLLLSTYEAAIRKNSELVRTRDQLQVINEQLERRVAERTVELATMVRLLQQEIVERERTEQRLFQSSEELTDLYDNAPCGYHSLDKDGVFVRINNTELRWLGYARHEVIRKMKFVDLLTPQGRQTFQATFPVLKTCGQVMDIEQELVRKDGSILPVILSATAIRDQHGDYLMSRSTMFDISELKELERKNRQKDRIMMQQSRQAAMGEMIGNIAHQWRQPLNVLGLTIQRVQLFHDMGKFDKEFLAESTAEAMRVINHMSQTIDDFRNFFSPNKERETFTVCEALDNAISLMDVVVDGRQIEIEVEPFDNPIIHGYRNEYSQVLINILMNSKDAFLERRIACPRIHIRILAEGDRSVVTLADNAGGIDEDIIGKIFDPYFTTKGPQKGTGVGLFMSKTIIETNMNGRLTVSNTADGAEFRIEL